ncbi:DUF2207 domain-containing protein [Salinicoccus halitifaciens]|uniref:DUF2207 domain-containing protein n=1 Tax=Salinicoccus halitifaciens TaxID=1073415 RepID=A0ABV2ED36_9STAP|nr:DUF2207 domain-containing protein [Salinicoccus halitifaciens]MCD2138758.1 DUF2207 domain-containing protein [Salinicoccus halitifaciens]
MKQILGMMVTVAAFLMLSLDVQANEITSMQMDVVINEDGSVTVTETRQADMSEGTENYIVFNDSDMGEVEVSDFSVEGFTEEPDWDTDAELEEKAGRYGVLDTDEGTELVWGIGEYGEQTYVVNYTLENVVRNLEDGQSLYWNFDTFTGIPTESFVMEVTSDVPLDNEAIRFWGFGFEGDIVSVGDAIRWTAADTLTSGNDVVLLMHFPQGTYNTDVTGDGTLEEEAAAAMDGSIYDDGSLGAGWIAAIVGGIGAVIAAVLIFFTQYSSRQAKGGHVDSKPTIKRRNKGLETGTPPSVDDYAGISYVLMHQGMSYFEEIFQAYLMKWTDEGRITIEIHRRQGEKLSKGKPEIIIHDHAALKQRYSYTFKETVEHLDDEDLDTGYDALLWRMLIDAADEGGYIDEKQLRKWSKKHAKEVSTLADELEDYSKRWLEANGYFTFTEDKVWGIPVSIDAPTEKGEALIDQLAQYKNYLKTDYTRIYQDDHMYRSHMIWSVLVGEGDEVRKHLSKLTPDDNIAMHRGMMYYYYGPHLASDSWSKGLGQGGFQSSNSSAAASGGGAR